MPIYQLTSPTTGQSYRIKADGNLTAQDADFAVAHFDRQYLEANSISPELAAQTPLQTFGNAIPQGFAKVGTAMLGGASAVLDKGSEIVTNLTGLPRVEMFQQGRTLADIMALNAEDTFPTNPLNVKANVVGAGAAQGMSLLAGGAVGKALGASNAALTTAPLVAGGLAGAGEGIRTAEDIGVQSPAAQLAMGVLFGGVEAGTEMIGGFGNKAATEALLSSGRKSAAAMLKEAAKTTVIESGEEMLAGSAQDLLTRAFATEDPSRPGFTKTGVELPKLDRKMLERRGYEALGGMAGGSIFAGAQVLANTALPPPNDSLPPDQTAPAPGAPPSPPGTAPAPGLGASPPPGLEEDLGDLTAEDVADLAPASPPLPLPLTPTPTLPPQPQGVGGGVRGGEGATVQPAGVIATPAQTITGSNVQTGTEMPVPSPTAQAGAGTGAVAPLPAGQPAAAVPASSAVGAAQQANPITTTRDEAGQPPGPELAPPTVAAAADAAAVEVKPPKRWSLPIRPRADGVTDILDYMSGEGIKLMRPPRIERDRMGRQTNAFGEHDAMKRLRQQLPAYYRAMTTEQGYQPDEAAQILYEAGFIRDASPDAITDAIEEAVSQRRSLRNTAREDRLRMAAEERAALRQGRRQEASWQKANQPAADRVEVPSENMVPGMTLEVDGEPMTVLDVSYDQDGYWDGALVEDGDRFGRQWIDNGELVHADAGTVTEPAAPPAGPDFADLAAPPTGVEQGMSDPFASLLSGTESTRPRNRGETARPQNADPLGELQSAKLAGEANQAQGRMEPLMSPANRLGRGLADLMPGQVPSSKSQVPSSRPLETSNLKPETLSAAYATAARGSSTAMIPLAEVFAAAQQQNPALTPAQFQAQVLAGYESGTVLLEGAGSQQEAQSAGLRIDGTPVGTAVRMMVPQGEGYTVNASRSLSPEAAQRDADYLAAVQAGDMETAQRLVDQAAKAAGYLPHGDFRDSHAAPSNQLGTDEDVRNGDADASLVQVARGVHNQPADYFDPFVGPRYYSYQDKAGMEAFKALRAAMDKIQQGKKALVTVYRAVPTDIKGTKLENRDWVTPSKTYAVDHGESRFGKDEYRIIKESVPAESLFWDGNDIREWGKDDARKYFYKNTANNIKSADPVTYDNNGNVIPLSQRFQTNSPDIRFSPSTQAQNDAAQARNEAALKALGLPSQKGTRIWGKAKVSEALRRIARDDKQPATLRFMARLLSRMPLGNLLLRIEADARLSYAGQYQPMGTGRGEIALNTRVLSRGQNTGQGDVVESLVHEVLHHVTYNVLRNPKTAAQKQAKADLEALRKRALAALSAQEMGSQFDYELSNVDEFISALFTRADFQTALASIPLDAAPRTLGQRVRTMLDEVFRILAELVTGQKVEAGSVLEASFASTLRLIEANNLSPSLTPTPPPLQNPAAPIPNETQSRFASPDPAGRTINGPRTDEIVAAEATAWLDSVDPQTAVELFHQRAVPLPLDAMEHAAALLLSRLSGQAVSGSSEVQRMWAHTQAQRMGRLWTREFLSADPARALRQRGVVNNTILAPIAPVLAAQEVLTDRAEAAIGPRFEGGTEGVTEKVKEILQQSELDISERVERILQAVMGPRLQPRVSIREAVAGLVNGRTQRQQMIDDVAKALMQRARTRQVTPGQQTALAALVASLKRTLGAAVRGEALKPEAVPMGELLARTFVDQVAEAPLFEEAWNAGRQQVLDMLMETGMTEADARTRLNQLMPATPTVAYAPGMVKQLVKRGFEQAGYGTTLATGSNRTGTRTLDVRTQALRDPAKALNAVLKVWDDAAMEAGISPEAWQGGRQLAINALNETMGQWQQQQAEAQAKAAAAAKASLLAKDSPALQKLLRNLREKIAPGMSWADIFTELPGTQKDRQREIYRRLMLDERLSGLTQDERLALTNELDKAWQRERRKVFINALKREAGLVMRDGVLVKKSVLGEKDKKDLDKVKAATPRLLRLMNLGMLNSDMVREALAEEYGVRQITPAIAAELRALGERIQTAPEGLPRRKLEQQLVEKLQSLVDATLWQTIDSYWTASVLSGWRTQVDIGLSIANGIEDVGLGSVVTAIRTGNKDVAVRALGALFGRIPSAFMEAVDHIATGNKAMMRNFELEAKQAMEGGNRLASDVGAAMWKRGGWRKVPGGFMVFYGRLLTALDHINSASTREGALAMALARHPELYQKALRITPADRAAARKQARQELTLGTAPANRQQRLEEDARVREILEQGTPPELLDEALEVGRRAALQGEPTGIGGTLLDAVLSAVNVVNKKATELAGRENADAITKQGAKVTGALVPFVRALTGTKFARTVAHALNRNLSYVPGVGFYAVGQQGRTGAFADILMARQIIGTLVGIAAYLAFDDDEDEKGIEDGWKDKTPQQKAQLYAQGKQPFTVWGRDAQGRVVSYNYQQWGIAGILNTVAAMLKQKDSEAGTMNVLTNSLIQGAMSFTDKAQLQGLQTVFGDNYRSTDPASGIASNLNKWAAQTVGGLVPRIAKDIDNQFSPELRDSSQWWQRWVKEVPMVRELSSGKRVNILGEDIKLDRGPLSRVRQVGTADPAYRTLGLLNSRDIYLPDPSTGVRIVRLADGTRRPMTPQEKDRYQRLTGAAYRQLLTEKGPQLLQMDPEDAKDYLLKTTKRLRDRAAVQAVR